MKNVILVSIAKQRWAIELGWVSDVITLEQVTIVPTAPADIYGVINFDGALIPVIDFLKFAETNPGQTNDRSTGETVAETLAKIAILVQVESVRIALRVDAVIEVTTLHDAESSWVDAAGSPAQLIDPVQLIEVIRTNIDSGIAQQRAHDSENAPKSRDR